jgi:hypothetical protein
MAIIDNIFGAKMGGLLPNVGVNSRKLDDYSLIGRIIGQGLAAYKDLNRINGYYQVQPEFKANPPQYYQVQPEFKANPPQTHGTGDLNNFISAFKEYGSFAKPNWFKVFITSPIQSGAERDISLFCEKACIPAHNIMTSGLRTYGPAVEYAYGKAYDPITLDFIVDETMMVRTFFDNWAKLIYDSGANENQPGTNDVAFPDSYGSTITIYQLAPYKEQNVHITYLHNAYPKVVTQMDLDQSQANQFHRLQVQFVYSAMYNQSLSITAPTLNKNISEAVSKVPNYSTGGIIYTEDHPFGTSFDNLKQQMNIQNEGSMRLFESAKKYVPMAKLGSLF